MKRTTERLENHTWLKIGGRAEMAVPESTQELITLLETCASDGRPYRLLGNGSNLLVSEEGVDELVIKTTDACTDIDVTDGTVRVGTSIAAPQFANILVQHGLGGYEFLYSVPGTIGGAIYMNAGRGERHDTTIADHLVEVEVFDGESVRTMRADDLTFDHRYSSFHEHPKWTILSATFEPPQQPSDVGREKIRQRMEKVNKRERSKPNAGSVFKSGVRLPLDRIPPNGLCVGDARFVHSNRICHNGNSNSEELLRLIHRAQLLHKLLPWCETPQIEWEIWD